MDRFTKLIVEMAAHALRDYPREACGVILKDFTYVPCLNLSNEPTLSFILDPGALIEYDERIWGIFHSHPGDDNPIPSEDDKIQSIEDPKEWSAGSTAVHLACQDGGCTELYMFGFDLSEYDNTKNINNMYKGTDNYLPENCKGTLPNAWRQQLYLTFREFSNVKFKWVGNDFRYVENSKIKECANVEFLTYDNIRL